MLSPLFDFNERFRLFDSFERQADRVFAGQGPSSPRMILRDTGDDLHLVAELPGVAENDLDISLESDVLTLRVAGDRQVPSGHKLIRSERPSMRMVRQVELPVRVDTDNLQATLRDGILELKLPKAKEARPRKIPVLGAPATQSKPD